MLEVELYARWLAESLVLDMYVRTCSIPVGSCTI